MPSASPATSPGLSPLASSSAVGTETGPIDRCVSVLRAHQRSAAGSACSRRNPGRSVSDHLDSTGTWFHCQAFASYGPPKSSSRW